jgi:hypothetical protein
MRILNEARKKGNREAMWSFGLLLEFFGSKNVHFYFDSNWPYTTNLKIVLFQKATSKGSLNAIFCLNRIKIMNENRRKEYLNFLFENNYSFAIFEKGIDLISSLQNFEEGYSLLLKGAENGTFGLSHHLFQFLRIFQFLSVKNN